MRVIWHKIWNDIWKNKSRTAQVVVIIAMGAFAIGMIITTSEVMRVRLAEVWQAANPAMINLTADPPLNDEQLTALKSIEGVTDVEGYLSTNVEWRLSPDQPWSSASLIARADYGDQTYAKLTLLDGHWPSRKRVAVEKGSDSAFNLLQGQPVIFRIKDHEYTVQVGGVIFNPFFGSPSFQGQTQFYASRDEFTNLTSQEDFNEIRASAPVYDETAVKALADRMQRQLEKLDVDTEGAIPTDSGDARILDPSQHIDQNTVDAVFLILGVMGGLALVLGLLLVYNTITAIVGEQVTQIGVMKAIGAGVGQILLIYFSGVLVYGVLALLVAIPLSALGAQQLSNFLLYVFNLDPGPLTLSPTAVLVQTAIALLAPLLAALVPIIVGARITVREAISTYGLGGGSGLQRLLAGIQRLSRLVLLTLNNTFRNRGRVIVTQLALVVSGLIFMMIMTVQDSVVYTFSDLVFSILKFNVSLQFEEPERMQEVERLTLAYPGVKNVEMWGYAAAAKIRPAGQPESNADKIATLFGVPLPTYLYGPQLRAGRWLQPDDTYAVVLNQKLAEQAGVGLGDWVTLDHGSQGESKWLVVGLLFDPVISNSAHVPRAMMLREIRSVNKTGTVWIQTNRTDAVSETNVAKGLRAYYNAHELKVNPRSPWGEDTSHQLTERVLNSFGIITKMLAAMAVIIALVGSIALSGVLSLSVRERTREIGVMRAIGASSRSIAWLFIGEGLILGLLSWLIALPFSIPAGYLMTQAVASVFGVEIIFHYTPAGALYWLAIITVLAIAASWLPAHGATRVSVRESLAYQ